MKVSELISKLSEMPQDLDVYCEGEMADKVCIETCMGYSIVRIFKAWDLDLVLGSAGMEGTEFPICCGEDVRCDEVGENGCPYLDETGECSKAAVLGKE